MQSNINNSRYKTIKFNFGSILNWIAVYDLFYKSINCISIISIPTKAGIHKGQSALSVVWHGQLLSNHPHPDPLPQIRERGTFLRGLHPLTLLLFHFLQT